MVKRVLGVIAAGFCAAAGLAVAAGAQPGVGSQGADSGPGVDWAVEVAVRDGLVAEQEALLNAYRCRFGVDVEAVAGGCSGGVPVLAPVGPGVFEGVAGEGDVAERDALVASQEALLNAYRCRFDIDIEAVAGGCWGGVPALSLAAEAGEPAPAVLAVGSGRSCAIRDDQTVACWGTDHSIPDDVPQPGGRFIDVEARHDYVSYYQNLADSVCGIRVNQTLACWGDPVPLEDGEEEGGGGGGSLLGGVPGGRFIDVALGDRHGCAIRVDQSLVCWGQDYQGPLRFAGLYWEYGPMGVSDAPEGRFRSVSSHYEGTCAVRVDLALACWGPPFEVPPRPGVPQSPYEARARQPEGRFTDVAVGYRHACAIRVERTLACWGSRDGPLDPPQGEFTAIASSYGYSCAIRTDMTLACWASTIQFFQDVGQIHPPQGQFTAIATGHRRACAQRSDGQTLCWGDHQTDPYTAPPPIQAIYIVTHGAQAVPGRPQQIAQWIEEAQQWYRDQTGGRHPLFARDPNGNISITTIVQETEDQRAYSLAREKHGAHIPYAMFIEWHAHPSPSHGLYCAVALSLNHLSLSLTPSCLADRDEVQYSLRHELVHLLDAVMKCAPNHFGNSHVNDSPRDIMFARPGNIGYRTDPRNVLDVGRDDYYGHGRDDCYDIARNPLLGVE